MKLATLNDGSRDGALFVVSKDGKIAAPAGYIAPTMQSALDDWDKVKDKLEALYKELNDNNCENPFITETVDWHSPLPRSYGWVDGSAYINHIILVRKARGAEPPATLETDPLVYQGGSDSFLPPCAPIPLADEAWGCDFESEIAIVTGDVPQGVKAADAEKYIRLIMLCNDVTLRNLIPPELAKGFGFYCSKPPSSFSPFAVTLEELGDAWKDGRVHLPLLTHYNEALFGDPNAGPEMHFSFLDLIEHAAKTRPLSAGTIIGSGTISNEDRARGSSCLAEQRMLEKIDTGEFKTPFMKFGDKVKIEMLNESGENIFGTIEQVVEKYEG